LAGFCLLASSSPKVYIPQEAKNNVRKIYKYTLINNTISHSINSVRQARLMKSKRMVRIIVKLQISYLLSKCYISWLRKGFRYVKTKLGKSTWLTIIVYLKHRQIRLFGCLIKLRFYSASLNTYPYRYCPFPSVKR